MKQIRRLLAFGALLLLLVPALALAQGRVIVDDTTGQVDEAAVQRAAQALTSKNATVVVLVSDQTGSDPQTYASGRLQSFGVQANPLDPTAIVYLVALDRRNVFIYYGADWNATLGPAYKNIADQQMIPQLARGNVTEGLVAGIGGTVDAIDNPAGAPISLWPIALAIIVIGLLVVGLPLLWRTVGKRRAAARAFEAARQAAETARKRAGAAIADFGQAFADARAKAEYDQFSYAPGDVMQIGQWQAEAERQFGQAQEQFDTVGEALAASRAPSQPEYERASQGYEQVLPLVESARAVLAQAEARRTELDQLNASAPAEVDRPKKALADAAAQLAALGADFSDPQAILRPLEELVARAEALLAEHRAADAIAAAGAASAPIDDLARTLARYAELREGVSVGRAAAEHVVGQGYRVEPGLAAFDRAEGLLRQAAGQVSDSPSARDLLDQAEAARAEGVARGGGMPALRAANDTRLPELRQAAEQLAGYIAEGRSAFVLVNEFAEATWNDIRGNGSEAEQAAGNANRLIARAAERNTFESQDFLGAQTDLADADRQIGFARTLIDSILQRLKDLQAARDAAQAEIAAAQADIDTGWSFVRANDPDIGKNPERDLGQAAELLAQASAELQQSRPNWLTIVKQAQEANRLADGAIANARGELEAMNKLRAQAQRAQQLAAGEVQKIAQFAGLHEADLPEDSGPRLRRLQSELQQAYAALQAAEQHEETARAEDLRQANSRYTSVQEHAEALYQDLYEAFQRVDQLRRQLAGGVEGAEQALARAEQRYQTYSAYFANSSEPVRLIGEAQVMLDTIGNPRGEAQLRLAAETAQNAQSAAERAEQLIESYVRQVQRSQQRQRADDVLAGALIGGMLNSGGRRPGGGQGGGGSGGWSSGGGSMGGWGGGGGSGWGGGGGGGGGWGGGGGGGSGW